MSVGITSPFWLRNPRYQTNSARTTKALPQKANVVIVGGGLSGISILYWLQKQGIPDILLLEARGVASGATGRNGGHLLTSIYSPSRDDIELYGEQEMQKVHNFDYETVELISQTVKELGLEEETEIFIGGNLRVFRTQKEAEKAQSLVLTLQRNGPHPDRFEYWSEHKVNTALSSPGRFAGGIYTAGAGQMWPAKFVWALTEHCIENGANIQTNTRVNLVEDTPLKRKLVSTERGDVIADTVIYATNVYSSQLLPKLRSLLPITPVRGQVIATNSLTPELDINPFTVVTTDEDGDKETYLIQRKKDGRIVVGFYGTYLNKMGYGNYGVSNDIAKDTVVSLKLDKLIRTEFPCTKTKVQVDADWTGVMAYTADGHPFIGTVPTRLNEYICAGFNGHGMVLSFKAAKLIAGLVSGQISSTNIPRPFQADRYLKQDIKSKL